MSDELPENSIVEIDLSNWRPSDDKTPVSTIKKASDYIHHASMAARLSGCHRTARMLTAIADSLHVKAIEATDDPVLIIGQGDSRRVYGDGDL